MKTPAFVHGGWENIPAAGKGWAGRELDLFFISGEANLPPSTACCGLCSELCLAPHLRGAVSLPTAESIGGSHQNMTVISKSRNMGQTFLLNRSWSSQTSCTLRFEEVISGIKELNWRNISFRGEVLTFMRWEMPRWAQQMNQSMSCSGSLASLIQDLSWVRKPKYFSVKAFNNHFEFFLVYRQEESEKLKKGIFPGCLLAATLKPWSMGLIKALAQTQSVEYWEH